MGRLCLLCRRKSSKRDIVSLHKFPKNPITRKKWIKACDLEPYDNLTNISICSEHFHDRDFKSTGILKFEAVPSIDVPNPNSLTDDSEDKNNNDGIETNGDVKPSKPHENENVPNNKVNENVPNNSVNTSDNNVVEIKNEPVPIKLSRPHIKQYLLVKLNPPLKCEANENVGICKQNFQFTSEEKRRAKPEKKAYLQPQYVLKIETPDAEHETSNQRTEIMLNSVKDEPQELIVNRKSEKRRRSLQQVIAYLKMKKNCF